MSESHVACSKEQGLPWDLGLFSVQLDGLSVSFQKLLAGWGWSCLSFHTLISLFSQRGHFPLFFHFSSTFQKSGNF